MLSLSACAPGQHFTLFGYTTAPNYDTKYRTVYVPIFKNRTFYRGIEFDLTREVINQIEQKTPYKVVSCRDGADTEILGTVTLVTKTLLNRNQLNEVREAEMLLAVELAWRDVRTGDILSQPGPAAAPPPLVQAIPGRIENGQPAPVLIAPLGTPAAPLPTPIAGTPLPSAAPETPAGPPTADGTSTPGTPPPPGAPAVPAAPAVPSPALQKPPPFVVIQATADFRPELGESNTTALRMTVQRLATQIVSMMEKPW